MAAEYQRIIGFDIARALAVMVMVVVNFDAMMQASRFIPSWLEKVIDFAYGRAATIFVMLVGVSITLMYSRISSSAVNGLCHPFFSSFCHCCGTFNAPFL